MLVKDLGDTAMAATNLAFNVNSFAFMPMIGLGIATSTLVGQRLGEGLPDRAARAAWSACALGVLYMGAISAVYVLLPDLLFLAHGAGADKEKFEPIRDLAMTLLRFVAAYCVLDALAIVFSGALKGAGDTRFIFIVSTVMGTFLVVGAWVALQMPSHRLYWCWAVIMLWVWLMGMIFFLRFLQGKWRDMRVIEAPQRADEVLAPCPVEAAPMPTAAICETEGVAPAAIVTESVESA